MKQPRRVSPRVPYEEAVCLTRIDGGGRLLCRSVNLGITGLYVKCAEPCEIGTELVCSVLLPGGPRKLRGRVVRLISLLRGVGMAIAFEKMTDRDRAAIEQLIADHQRAVFQAKLRLGGMDQTVNCEAVFDARTVHLRAALPFLRLDADVGVMLGNSEELETSGVISKIALDPASDDGVPRLALDVQIGGSRATDDEEEDDMRPLPSALPAPYKPPLPKVLISKTLQHQAVRRPVLYAKPPLPRRPHPTAEIARRPRFTDWEPPPPLHTRGRAHHAPQARMSWTQRLVTGPRRSPPAWRWSYLLVLPLAAVLAALIARAVI